jgi:hypothetical protein
VLRDEDCRIPKGVVKKKHEAMVQTEQTQRKLSSSATSSSMNINEATQN